MIKKIFLLALAVFAVGMAVPNTRARIQEEALYPVKDAIGNRLVPRRLDAMANQLDVRLSRGEGLPADAFPGWLRIYYTGPELDPWENVWFIQAGRSNYTVGSKGPDGEQGTDDDIVVTRPLRR